MTHFQKSRLYRVLRWGFNNLSFNNPNSLKDPIYNNVHSCKFFGSVALDVDVDGENGGIRVPPSVKREVESVLLDYLHSTRNLLFCDAEHMSKNSPSFVKKLAENVRHEPDIRRSMARLLSYHPINEFEPFFESIGLDPLEFKSLLPRNLLFLSDEDGLLDNFHVLCEYGIERDKIGKIYREAREVFQYEHGVLRQKLEAFQEVGISRDVVIRVLSFNPNILVSGSSHEFFEVVRKLQSASCENSWVEERLVETTTYNWRQIMHLLHLLYDLGCNNEDIKKLVGRCPGILFDHSGRSSFSLVGFLLKFGSSKTDVCSLFLRFPQVRVEKFVWNLRRAFELLFEIEMDAVIIGRIIREHFTWMGTCSLKRANSVLCNLSIGKKRMCQIIMVNPLVLKNWTLRAKIERLSETREVRSRRDKIRFLTSIGFTEDSKEIEKALKVFRGKGDKLPERYHCLIKAGLSENDAALMIKTAPKILNQSVEVLEAKLSVLVNDLGYPVSSVRRFPGSLSYTVERVKLRCTMYRWLIDQKVVLSTLSLSTVIGCREFVFFNRYVSKHPEGPEVWQNYKRMFSSVCIENDFFGY